MNGFSKAWEKVAEGDYGGAFKSVKQQVKKVRSRLPLSPFLDRLRRRRNGDC